MLLTPFMFSSGLFPNTLLLLCELRQWGKVVVAICRIRIVDSTIMFRHGKGAVPKQLLEHKGIPATIDKVFTSEGVAERMNRSPFHASGGKCVPNCELLICVIGTMILLTIDDSVHTSSSLSLSRASSVNSRSLFCRSVLSGRQSL